MKNVFLILVVGLAVSFTASSQSMSKKYKTFEVSRVLPFSAEKVWAAVADDYGNIANSHPKIVASNYTSGSLKGGKGAERVCYFNDKKTKMLHERITDWNPEKGYFVNRILKVGKFPVDPDNTRGTYFIKSLGPNQSQILIKMEFRTKPAFMGFMAKGQFKKLLNNYFIAVEHHLSTGENVTANNFKSIKKNYKKG